MVRPVMFVDCVIVGPTASGKSRFALALAKSIDAEIISADSRQIYRQISVGTGKLLLSEQEGVPHHLLDFCSITEPYSAGDFVRDARALIKDIRGRGKKVLLCGGTGLYLDSLLLGLVELPSRSPGHYEAYRQFWVNTPTSDLYSRLEEIDQSRAGRLHPNDRFRILRALYLHDEFSLTPTEIYERFRGEGVPWGGIIGLDPGPVSLHKRITERVVRMFEIGWIEEVSGLLSSGISPDVPGFNSLGYREVVSFLRGAISRDTLVETVILKTRQYAKRQRTWFRHMKDVHWLNPENEGAFPLDLYLKYGTIEKISCCNS